MEQTVIFEQKLTLSPKDMNLLGEKTIDSILLSHLQQQLERRCSRHGYVIPGTLEILSRSMGTLEHGRYTGNIIFYIQVQGKVYNPVNGSRITGNIEKKNKMGLYMIYNDAIRVLVPRDLHIGSDTYESLDVGQEITVEIRKSRFQIQDPFILSIGVLVDAGIIQPSIQPVQEKPVNEKEEEGPEEEEDDVEEEQGEDTLLGTVEA